MEKLNHPAILVVDMLNDFVTASETVGGSWMAGLGYRF